MALNTPALFGFSAEYLGEHPAFDELDQYFRSEFSIRHPGWEPRFGRATWFDGDAQDYDHLYLVTGNVPGASSQAEAENLVRKAFDAIAAEIGARRPAGEPSLPKPNLKAWRWPP